MLEESQKRKFLRADIFTALSFENINGTDHSLVKDYLNSYEHREEI